MGRPTGSAAILFCCICVGVALSASMAVAVGSATPAKKPPKFISSGVLLISGNITKTTKGRKLGMVEATGAAPPPLCPVRFDVHTRGIGAVIASCKDRPVVSAERCCGALKTFACPYSELLNDNDKNGCADDMMFEIVVRGRLRPGIFSHLCHETSFGINC